MDEQINILKSVGFGKREYDFEKIKLILDNDPHLKKCWAEKIGISETDNRIVFGWPYDFENFYSGYCAYKFKN